MLFKRKPKAPVVVGNMIVSDHAVIHMKDSVFNSQYEKNLRAAREVTERMNKRARERELEERPWHVINTGIMSGAISLKNNSTPMPDEFYVKQLRKHETETPIFFEAVMAHNKGVVSDRKKRKNELQPQ